MVSGELPAGEKESVVPLHLRPCNLGHSSYVTLYLPVTERC